MSNRIQIERLQQRAVLSLSEIVATVEAPEGRARLATYLENRPYPRFQPHPELARTFIREDADGSRMIGRFRHGAFEPIRTIKVKKASTA